MQLLDIPIGAEIPFTSINASIFLYLLITEATENTESAAIDGADTVNTPSSPSFPAATMTIQKHAF
jgi:hypothetical protein